MKKLMIAAAIVCAAVMSQGATGQWGSGAMYTAASANGGWSSTLVNNAGALVTMNVFLVDEATYNTVSKMDQAGIYGWAADKTADYTGQNLNGTAKIGAVTIKDETLAGETKYYSILTAEYTDANYGDMYMATATILETPASGQKALSNLFGGASTLATGGVRDWQAVPEPTSGLLFLLGVAGLALRRRRA